MATNLLFKNQASSEMITQRRRLRQPVDRIESSGPDRNNVPGPIVGYSDKTLLGINAENGSVHKDNAA